MPDAITIPTIAELGALGRDVTPAERLALGRDFPPDNGGVGRAFDWPCPHCGKPVEGRSWVPKERLDAASDPQAFAADEHQAFLSAMQQYIRKHLAGDPEYA